MEQVTYIPQQSGRTRNTQEVISALREEAAKNKAFNAVCHFFALRRRTRAQLTVKALELKMKKEKFEFTTEEYQNIVKLLGSVGLGKLELDSKGRPRALKDIKMTLQSIGKAAISKTDTMEAFYKVRTFSKLPEILDVQAPTNAPQPKQRSYPAELKKFAVQLNAKVSGKTVDLLSNISLTPDEIGMIVSQMLHKSM